MNDILLVGCFGIFALGILGLVNLIKTKSNSLSEYVICIGGVFIGLFMGYLIIFYK